MTPAAVSGRGSRPSPAALLFWILLAASAYTLALSIFVPIYHDEVGWKILQARLGRDGGVNIHQLPTCGASFATPPPPHLLPFRVLDELVYGNLSRPLMLRVGGILTHLAWLVLLVAGLRRALDSAVERRPLFGLLFAFLGLGTLPFLLVLNRPEQLVLVGATLFVFAPWFLRPALAGKTGREWAVAAALVVTSVWLFGLHAKAIVLLPSVCVAIGFSLPRRAPRWSALALTVALALATAHYWQERFACPDDPHVAATLRDGLAVKELKAGRVLFLIGVAWEVEIQRDVGFVQKVEFGGDDWNWLQPTSRIRDAERMINQALRASWLLVALCVAGLTLATATRAARARRLELRGATTLALLSTLGVLFLLQTRRAPYEAGLLFALALLVVALNAPPLRHARLRSGFRAAAVAFMLFALASQAILWRRFLPRVPVNRAALGHLDGQPLSLAPFRQREVNARVLEAAGRCGIDPSARLPALVLDDVTNPALLDAAWRPLHISYLSKPWGAGIRDLDRFLAERGSAGMVVRCHLLPEELAPRAVRTGELCCLPAFRERTAPGAP